MKYARHISDTTPGEQLYCFSYTPFVVVGIRNLLPSVLYCIHDCIAFMPSRSRKIALRIVKLISNYIITYLDTFPFEFYFTCSLCTSAFSVLVECKLLCQKFKLLASTCFALFLSVTIFVVHM